MYERGGQQHNAPSRLVWASTHMQRCDEWTGEKKQQQKLLSAKIVHLSVSSGNSSVKESDPHHLIINCEPYTDFIYDPKWFKNYICEPIVLAKKSNCLSKYRLVLKKIFPQREKLTSLKWKEAHSPKVRTPLKICLWKQLLIGKGKTVKKSIAFSLSQEKWSVQYVSALRFYFLSRRKSLLKEEASVFSSLIKQL